MTSTDSWRVEAIRTLIASFLQGRLADKLEKHKDDADQGMELRLKYEPETWIADAARRSEQIQAVTHSLKPIHPDARGTSLYAAPTTGPALDVVGTHALGEHFDVDVVGNAAALDVNKFLKLTVEGRTFLDLARSQDPDFLAALSTDPKRSRDWSRAFGAIAEWRGHPRSHSFAKQVYWLVGEDAHDDLSFHLLAPLFATSLAHAVYRRVQDDRFSDEAKAAREARRGGLFHPRPVREYGDLAVQKLGGTKPQNISQLNSERRGENYLLASLPPVWKSSAVRPLYGVGSLFRRFGRRREVLRLVRLLREFLGSDPARNQSARQHRDGIVTDLIDELIQMTAELRTLPPGWSLHEECHLAASERRWLDPGASTADGSASQRSISDDAIAQIAAGFANWLNARIRDPLPMGDPEYLHWRNLAHQQIETDLREAADE